MALSTGDFASAWGAMRDIEGWLSQGQALMLFEAAGKVTPGATIVEIGSHHGRSTVLLACAAPHGVDLVAIDPFDDVRWGGGTGSHRIFRDNLMRAGVEDRVRVIRGTSRDTGSWGEQRVGLVYVDAAHDEASVLLDIDTWVGRLENGGAVFFHDAFSSPGVTSAILKRFVGRRNLRYLGSQRSLVGFRKQEMSLAATLESNVRLLFRLIFFTRNVLVKLAIRYRHPRLARALGHSGQGFPY